MNVNYGYVFYGLALYNGFIFKTPFVGVYIHFIFNIFYYLWFKDSFSFVIVDRNVNIWYPVLTLIGTLCGWIFAKFCLKSISLFEINPFIFVFYFIFSYLSIFSIVFFNYPLCFIMFIVTFFAQHCIIWIICRFKVKQKETSQFIEKDIFKNETNVHDVDKYFFFSYLYFFVLGIFMFLEIIFVLDKDINTPLLITFLLICISVIIYFYRYNEKENKKSFEFINVFK